MASAKKATPAAKKTTATTKKTASLAASIQSVLPVPKKVVDAPKPADWAFIESAIGTPLPADYKEFLQTYGSGTISNYMRVLNPFSTTELWLEKVRFRLSIYHSSRRNNPVPGFTLPPPLAPVNSMPYPIFPESGGVFPWGHTENGDGLLWLTQGNPNEWKVVAETRSFRYAEFPGTMTEFLTALLSGKLTWGAFDPGAEKVPPPNFAADGASAGKGK
ncbi:MAG: SMI1/KNR4 family protein [Polyangiaceae bacterium]|nr:SMI1/KNR4 family protein [Polyangiaceae bacterium]